MTERRYRGKQSRPIPVWNGVLEHRERIGDAIWEFLWCLDAVTQEKDGTGIVYGGAPVKAERIAADLKRNLETTRKNLRKLADQNYLRTRRTPYGVAIAVLNSKKFGIWRKEKYPTAVSLPERNTLQVSEKHPTGVYKEDSAVEVQQKDTPQPAQDRPAEPRFQKIVDEFFRLSRAKGIEPAFDRSDGNQLNGWLARHPSTLAEKILATLANAFASSDPYPLRPGFRLREFLAHESKYQLGPLHKAANGNGNNKPALPSFRPAKKLTEEGIRMYEAFGIKRESLQ